MPPYTLTTPREIRESLAGRLRALRLEENLTQETLAKRAGVSLSSLKRFEREGLASFELVVSLAACLGRLDDLEGLFKPRPLRSIEEIDRLSSTPERKRGRR